LRDFVPIEDGKVKMYVCGPTVYNYIHVGNARSTVAFDTIRRYFEYRGYEVAYISNFTDVDDKIINRAKAQAEEIVRLKAEVRERREKGIAHITVFYDDNSFATFKDTEE